MLPLRGDSMPSSVRSSVVLPAPLAPVTLSSSAAAVAGAALGGLLIGPGTGLAPRGQRAQRRIEQVEAGGAGRLAGGLERAALEQRGGAAVDADDVVVVPLRGAQHVDGLAAAGAGFLGPALFAPAFHGAIGGRQPQPGGGVAGSRVQLAHAEGSVHRAAGLEQRHPVLAVASRFHEPELYWERCPFATNDSETGCHYARLTGPCPTSACSRCSFSACCPWGAPPPTSRARPGGRSPWSRPPPRCRTWCGTWAVTTCTWWASSSPTSTRTTSSPAPAPRSP